MGIGYYNSVSQFGTEIGVFFVFTVFSFIGGLVAATCYDQKSDWGLFWGAGLLWVIEIMMYLLNLSPKILPFRCFSPSFFLVFQ